MLDPPILYFSGSGRIPAPAPTPTRSSTLSHPPPLCPRPPHCNHLPLTHRPPTTHCPRPPTTPRRPRSHTPTRPTLTPTPSLKIKIQ